MALLAALIAFVIATSILFTRVKLRGRTARIFRRATPTPSGDTHLITGRGRPITSTTQGKSQSKRAKKATAVVVLAAAHSSLSTHPSPSSPTTSRSPFEQHGSSLISLLVLLLTTAPVLVLCLTRPVAASEVELRTLISEAEQDLFLSSCYILVLAGAAIVPVVHLLCDDVVCGVAVDLFRCLFHLWSSHSSGSNAASVGSENEAFIHSDNPDDV